MTDPALSFADTRALIASDARRVFTANGGGSLSQRVFWLLMPTFQALFWHRLSRYCYLRGWRNTAWLLFLFKLYRTRIEIPPTTEIGDSCLIAHASGVVLYGRIGARATIFGDAKVGGGVDNTVDIGGGPGYPVIGDDVIMGYRASVLGPYRVGDKAKLGPFAMALFDVPAGAILHARKSTIMRPSAPPDAKATSSRASAT
jgi:serine O-acetyltransferase